MSTEAMKLALEALEKLNNTKSYWWQEVDDDVTDQLLNAETALREALAQPQQEPVAWMSDRAVGFKKSEFGATPTVPLYTSPPAQRKPLTDAQIGSCIDEVNLTSQYGHHHFGWHKQFARAIEAKHGIKENT